MDPVQWLKQDGPPVQQERRASERVPLIRPCPYELSQIPGTGTMEFIEGITLSLNISSGGMLLLMPWAPAERQTFDVQVPSLTEEGTRERVVEVCWARELPIGVDPGAYLVGVRFLFEVPTFS